MPRRGRSAPCDGRCGGAESVSVIALADAILGHPGDRALDGTTHAVSLITGPRLSDAAWQALLVMLPFTDPITGSCTLVASAGTAWVGISAVAKAELVAAGFWKVTTTAPATLTTSVGFTGLGGLAALTWLNLPFTFATANSAALYTAVAPTSIFKAYWMVSTPFSGGSSPTIGMSTTNSTSNTPGGPPRGWRG